MNYEGLWGDATSTQKAEMMRLQDRLGVQERALLDLVRERRAERRESTAHEHVEAEVAQRLAVAAVAVGGAVPVAA